MSESVPVAPPPGPVLGVCGWSGSGKTTLLERFLPRMVARGLRVCALKHDAHGIRYDKSGKDSDRLFAAGADVGLRGPGESFFRRRGTPEELPAVLSELLGRYDAIFVEGHKNTPLPKVWLSAPDRGGGADPARGDTPPEGVSDVRLVLPPGGGRVEALERFVDAWLPGAWREAPVFAGILIGGRSRRMGSPKHLLSVGGRTFLERALAAIDPVVPRTVLIGAGDVPEPCAGRERLPDPPGLEGPLAGMLAALRWAPASTWLFTACDQPLIRPEAVRWLLECRAPGRWAVVPRDPDGRPEPLLALYDARIREPLERFAAAGHRAPSRLVDFPATFTPEPPAELADAWSNVNTPEQLERIARRLNA